MKITALALPPIGTNCYIVQKSDDAFVVDPASCAEKIFECAKKNKAKIRAILLTHGHFDHIGAVDELVNLTGADVYIHALDAPMLSDGTLNVSRLFSGKNMIKCAETKTVSDGDVINVGALKISVLHTPGHTAGSVCYLCENAIFTGDTVFYEGYGRTDLPTGDYDELMRSLDKIKEKIKVNKIYPGH